MAVSLSLVAGFVVFASAIAYYYGRQFRTWYLISKFDGPLTLPLVGTTYRLKRDPRESFLFAREAAERYRQGGLYRVWYGTIPGLVIFAARHMEVILNSNRHLEKANVYRFIEPWLGKGLLTSGGEKWFHRRKLLTPTFHFSILQNFIEVFNEQSFNFVEKMKDFADKPDPVNVFPYVTRCVLDIICSTAMGKNINAQSQTENEYVKTVLRMSALIVERARFPWLQSDFIFSLTKAGQEQKKYLEYLHNITDTMIQERLRDPPKSLTGEADDTAGMFGGKHRRVAFLDLLLKMHREDKNFTLKDIREEVDTFMFEGHDTTAAAVSWAIHQIGRHPQVQRRLHEEIDDIFGDSDRPVTSEDLAKMSYLNCVVKEVLRLFPSVPIIIRGLEDEIVIDGKVVPKETMIMCGISNLHRDPEQFPDPDRFDPDRFLPENVAKRHPFAYVPFSAGPRNCIGQKFALMEDKVILVNLLRKFSIESVQSVDEAKPAGQLVIRPAHGQILVKISSRK